MTCGGAPSWPAPVAQVARRSWKPKSTPVAFLSAAPKRPKFAETFARGLAEKIQSPSPLVRFRSSNVRCGLGRQRYDQTSLLAGATLAILGGNDPHRRRLAVGGFLLQA